MSLTDGFSEDENRSFSTTAIEDSELPSEHDLRVLKAIGEDEDIRDVSFQGIRRKLGLHQETLSRALHRLQRDGYVERLEHAYRISPKGLSTIGRGFGNSVASSPIHRVEDLNSVPLLTAKLPSGVSSSELIDSLSYKWFGNLRWLGSALTPETATLNWVTNDEPPVKISVKIREDELSIDVFPSRSSSISDAARSAYELFDHVSKAIKEAFRRTPTGFTGKAA
jgi:DNA-binding Lrp family transcriptional regulator